MKLFRSSVLFTAYCIIGLTTFARQAVAAKCDANSPERIMPYIWGSPGDRLRNPLILPCDTMIVRAGDTSKLYSGTMLHFGETSSEKKVLIVNGTLIAIGTHQEPVYFSGTIVESDFGLRPGKGRWGGIIVSPGGSLTISDGLITNAEILDIRSKNATIQKTYVSGCPTLKGVTNTTNLPFKGAQIDFWSAQDTKEARLENPMMAQKTGTGKSESTPKLGNSNIWWSILGGTTLLAGGGLLWYKSTLDDKGNPATTPDDGFSPNFPSEPTTVGPRN